MINYLDLRELEVMMRKILAFLLLVGTGGLLLIETLFDLRDKTSLLFLTSILGVLFITGVYYHIKGLRNS